MIRLAPSSYRRADVALQVILIILIILPIAVVTTFSTSYTATVDLRGPDIHMRAPLTARPIASPQAVERFIEKCVVLAMNILWEKSAGRYSSADSSACFSNDAWERYKAAQVDDNIVPYLTERQLNRIAIALADPVVVSTSAHQGHLYFMVQGLFLQTIRGQSEQRSSKYLVHAVVRTTKGSANGALEVISYKEARMG